MAMRVATFALSSTLLNYALTTQAKLAEKQTQEASGLISSDYGGLGSDAGKLVDLEVSKARAESYSSAAEQATNRVEVMYSATGSIVDALTQARTEISAASVDTSDIDTLQDLASSMLEEVESLLNTQYEGRYLFAGGNTQETPVDLDSYTGGTDLDTADTSYYTGDDTIISVQVGSERTVSYGVTADNDAFEKTIRALSYIANADSLNSDDLEAISDMLVDAQDAVIAIQSGLSLSAASLENAQSEQDDLVALTESSVEDIRSADLATVAVEVAQYETQLEASYAAVGKLTSLSLLDYL
ncbi:flagellar hook-associated protein 3 FlgL [Breoghania corrubedonensis]|uniref:Flagellar hook-associated protein 3 FlgL n=1 Tax=Breoghania corrubedonensis TaxID=665038 RepID=A0A2T5V6E4_9HYPH|nr:flagellin [Breoghania corrubedonensis]PTW59327.1 flagellar hook-associated protein 3 FlgL [Breoghania corrubedonensis]